MMGEIENVDAKDPIRFKEALLQPCFKAANGIDRKKRATAGSLSANNLPGLV